MREIELFDGTILEFPDDTADDVIDRIAKRETSGRRTLDPRDAQARTPQVESSALQEANRTPPAPVPDWARPENDPDYVAPIDPAAEPQAYAAKVRGGPPEPSKPQPYRDKADAADDALNFIDEGVDRSKVVAEFSKIGLTDEDFAAAAQRRGQQWSTPGAQPMPALQDSGTISGPNNEGANFGTDTGNLLGLGVDSMALGARWLVGKASPGFAKLLDAAGGTNPARMRSEMELRRNMLSEEQQAAGEKEWISSKPDETFGDAWSDPRAYYGALMESAPATIASMGPTAAIWKVMAERTFAKAVAGGATQAAAAQAAGLVAQKAALVAGGLTEGVISGSSAGQSIEQQIMDLPESTLNQSEAYRTLRQTMSPEQARAALASDRALIGSIIVGATTAAFGGQGDAVLARIFRGQISDKLLAKVAAGTTSEALLEEFPQSYLEQVGQNIAMRGAGADVGITEGALNQAVGGAVVGGIMGGGMAAAAHPFSRQPPPPVAAPAAPEPTLERRSSEPNADAIARLETARAAEQQRGRLEVEGILAAPSVDEAIARAMQATERPNMETPAVLDVAVQNELKTLRALGATPEQLAELGLTPQDIADVQAVAPQATLVAQQATPAPVAPVAQTAQEPAGAPAPVGMNEPTGAPSIEQQAAATPAARPFVTLQDVGGRDEQASAYVAGELRPVSQVDIVSPDGTPFGTREAAEQVAATEAFGLDLQAVAINRGGGNRGWQYVLRKRERAAPGPQAVVPRQRSDANEEALQRLQAAAAAVGAAPAGAQVVSAPDSAETVAAKDAVNAQLAKDGQPAIDMFEVDVAIAAPGRKDEASLTEVMAEAVGVPIKFIKATNPNLFNGLYHNGTLFASVDAPRPLHSVFGHELVHKIRDEAPELYDALVKAVAQLVKPGSVWYQKYHVEPGSMRADKVVEEMLADVSGDAWADPTFIRELAALMPNASAFAKLKSRMLSMLDKIIRVLTRRGYGSSEFVTDVKRVRAEIAKMTAAYAQQAQRGLPSGAAPVASGAAQPAGQPATPTIDRLFARGAIGNLLDSNEWAILTAENPGNTSGTPQENLQRNEKLAAELRERGIEHKRVFGKYSEPEKPEENSFIIIADEKTASELGKKYGQESVLTSRGLVYADGRVTPSTEVEVIPEPRDNYYSRVTINGKETIFAVGLDFEKTAQFSAIPPEELVEEEEPEDERENRAILPAAQKIAATLTFAPIKDATPENILKVARKMVRDAKAELLRNRAAEHWYRDDIKKSFDIVAERFPEVLTNDEAKHAFTVALAITSNGLGIAKNSEAAVAVYEYWKDNGVMPDVYFLENPNVSPKGKRLAKQAWLADGTRAPQFDKFGVRNINIADSLRLYNALVGDLGFADAKAFLAEKFAISELEAMLDGTKGVAKIPKAYVVYGSAIFGPKIGHGFVSNLLGRLDAGTLDRWFWRTWGRHTNTLVRRLNKKDGTSKDIVVASPTSSEWAFAQDSIQMASKMLRDQGYDVSTADVQALLWYHEKSLYEQMGAANALAAPTSYSIELRKVIGPAKAGADAGVAQSGGGQPAGQQVQAGGAEAVEGIPFSRIAPNTPEFKRWFGDSKVVDEKGKPLVVYHGTFADVTELSPAKSEDGAFHFGTNEAAAERLAGKRGTIAGKKAAGQNIMPVYLSIRNPKRLTIDPVDPKSWRKAIAQAKAEGHDGIVYPNAIEAPGAAGLPDDVQEMPSETYSNGVMLISPTLGVLADLGSRDAAYKKARARVSMGVVKVPAESWVAFRPEQIKSAIGNRGTFDPANPDIRMSLIADERGRLDGVEAYHYSTAPRTVLTGSSYGSNYAGSGKQDYLTADDKRRRQRVYFYIDKGTGIRPEGGVGGVPHRAILNNVYDANRDPLKLRGGTQEKSETNILNAGFDGYLDRLEGTQSGQVIMLGEQRIPVESLPPGRVESKQKYEPVPKAKPQLSLIDDIGEPDEYIDFGSIETPSDLSTPTPLFDRMGEDLEGYRADLARDTATLEEVGRGWLKLAQDKSIFTYPESLDSDLENVAYDMSGTQVKVKRKPASVDDKRYSNMEPPPLWTYELTFGPQRAKVFENKKGELALNIADFKSGGKQPGSLVYQIVGTWAANAGKTFIGDPAGITDRGVFRRTANMLSNALRIGSTTHLKPHQAQLDAGLQWRKGNDAFNVGSLAVWMRDTLALYSPQTYDPAGFVSTDPYRSLGSFRPSAGVNPDAAKGGARTSRQAAVTDSLLQGAAGTERSGVTRVATEGGAELGADNPDVGGLVERTPLLYSRIQTPLGFYSELREKVAEVDAKAMRPADWITRIKALKGVKAEEIEWTEVLDILQLKPADKRLSKEEVLEILDSNGVLIEEAVLGNQGPAGELPAILVNWYNNAESDPPTSSDGWLEAADYFEQRAKDRDAINKSRGTAIRNDWWDLAAAANEMAERMETQSGLGFGALQYAEYFKEGKNLRQFLLRMPSSLSAADISALAQAEVEAIAARRALQRNLYDDSGATEAQIEAADKALALAVSRRNALQQKQRRFNGAHWAQENVFAHLIVSEDEDAQGNRLLRLLELQSDWAQTGRREGFKRTGAQDEYRALSDRYQALEDQLRAIPHEIGATEAQLLEYDRLATAQTRLQDEMRALQNSSGSTSPAPFVSKREFAVFKDGAELDRVDNEGKRRRVRYGSMEEAAAAAKKLGGEARDMGYGEDTEAWVTIGLKRALRIAAEEGLDKVALVTGQQAVNRYPGLSTVVSSMDWSARPDGSRFVTLALRETSPATLVVDKGGAITSVRGSLSSRDLAGKRLDEAVGKDVAKRVMGEEEGSISGAGLDIGGSGMRAFYDRIVPAVANKLLAKLGGGKVTEGRVGGVSSSPYKWQIRRDDGTLLTEGGSTRFYNDADTGRILERHTSWKKEPAERGDRQLIIEVTPAMREKILGGLPMFSRLPPQPPQGQRFKLEAETRKEGAVRAIQDELVRLKRVQEQIVQQGGKLYEGNNAYLAATLMPGRIMDQIERFDDNELQPLLDFIGKNGIELDELALFAYAKHAPERNARIAQINPSIGPSGSGMSDADAAKVVADAQKSGLPFDAAHQRLMAITQGTRSRMLRSGLISRATFNEMQLYQNWMPLRGFENDLDEKGRQISRGSGFSIQGKETLRAMGRRSRAGQLIENVVMDRTKVIERAEKALVGRTLLQFVADNPDPALWEIDLVTYKPTMSQTATGRKVTYARGKDAGDNVFVTKVGGAEARITLKDEKLARAMKALDAAGEAGPILEFMSTFNRWLSRMLTGMNPTFVAVNALRDFQTAMFQGLRFGRGISKRIPKNIVPAFAAGMRKHYPGGAIAKAFSFGDVKKWDAILDKASAGGGRTGFFGLKTLVDTNMELQRALALHSKSATGWQKTQAMLVKVAEAIEGVNDSVEVATRVATYKAALDGGATEKEALEIMKEITVNFNRRGELTKYLQPWFLFVNPSVQGTAVLYRSLKNPNVRYLAGTLVAGSIALAMYGLSAGGDDDDDVPYWDKIPQEVRDRNLVIMLPPGEYQMDGVDEVSQRGRYIKIPLPYGINIFNALGNATVDGFRQAKDPKTGRPASKVAANLISNAFMNWNPLGGESPWTQVAPIAQPLLQPLFNYNRFGRPLAPAARPGDATPPAERFFEGERGGFSQAIASGINTALGGDEATTAPPIEMLPEQLQNVFTPAAIRNTIGYATGGPGMFIDRAILSPLVQANTRAEVDLGALPFIAQAYGTVDTREARRVYMDRAKESLKALDRAKTLWEAGKEPSPSDELLISAGAAAEKFDRALGALKKQEIALKMDKEITAAERRRELNTLELQRRQLYSDWMRIWRGSYDK